MTLTINNNAALTSVQQQQLKEIAPAVADASSHVAPTEAQMAELKRSVGELGGLLKPFTPGSNVVITPELQAQLVDAAAALDHASQEVLAATGKTTEDLADFEDILPLKSQLAHLIAGTKNLEDTAVLKSVHAVAAVARPGVEQLLQSDPDPQPYSPDASNSAFADSSNDIVTQMLHNPSAGFFALMFGTLFGCYKRVSDTTTLELLKQKRNQDAAGRATEVSKLIAYIKDTVNQSDCTATNLADIFKAAFGNPQDPKYADLARDFGDTLRCAKDSSGNNLFDAMIAGKFSPESVQNLLNGLIKMANGSLIGNGIATSCQFTLFTTTDISKPAKAGDPSKLDDMNRFLDMNSKAGEGAIQQLNTLNQTLQATINLFTQTLNGFLELMKSTEQLYGRAVSQQ